MFRILKLRSATIGIFSPKASTPAMRSTVADNGEHTGARSGTEARDAVAIGFQALAILFHVTQAGCARGLPSSTESRGVRGATPAGGVSDY
jgi:hypothetical protein